MAMSAMSAMSGGSGMSGGPSGSGSAMPGPSGSAMPGLSALEFPPLVPPVETDSQKIEDLLKTTNFLVKQQEFLMKQHVKHMEVREFTKTWCTRDLEICAGEIWKRSVRKHLGDGDTSDGRHLWDAGVQQFVQMASVAMEMTKQVHEMKELSLECILALNYAAHLTTIKALDKAVLNSEKAIAMFPDLEESHPSQCKTILKYSRFKTFLKDNFK